MGSTSKLSAWRVSKEHDPRDLDSVLLRTWRTQHLEFGARFRLLESKVRWIKSMSHHYNRIPYQPCLHMDSIKPLSIHCLIHISTVWSCANCSRSHNDVIMPDSWSISHSRDAAWRLDWYQVDQSNDIDILRDPGIDNVRLARIICGRWKSHLHSVTPREESLRPCGTTNLKHGSRY